MGQQEIQDFLMKEDKNVYTSTARIAKLLNITIGSVTAALSSMRRYGEIETVKAKIPDSHLLHNCHRLTKRGRGL